jgi:hypothetical protein
MVLHGWIRSSRTVSSGIPFKEFETVVAKIRHAFMAIPAGRGLHLTPCNKILQSKPPPVYLQRNPVLQAAIMGCQTLLQESSDSPTQCQELVGGWPDYIGVCDASSLSWKCFQHVATCRDDTDMSGRHEHVAPILARWVHVADTILKMSWQFVSAFADISQIFQVRM